MAVEGPLHGGIGVVGRLLVWRLFGRRFGSDPKRLVPLRERERPRRRPWSGFTGGNSVSIGSVHVYFGTCAGVISRSGGISGGNGILFLYDLERHGEAERCGS